MVASGAYAWTITGADAAGNPLAPVSGSVTVDTQAPQAQTLVATPATFRPARGEITSIAVRVSETASATITVVSGGTTVRTLSSTGAATVTWDGRNSAGAVVPAATCTLNAIARGSGRQPLGQSKRQRARHALIPRSVADGRWPMADCRQPSCGQSLCIGAACLEHDVVYHSPVPKLWNDTIETHRREVRDAVLETTAALVAKHGHRSVTMSQVAEEAGIGRATLYKYFPSVEAILVAWHEGHIMGHLHQLVALRDQAGDPLEKLKAVLETYALIHHEHHGTELAVLLHRGEHVARAEKHLHAMLGDLVKTCTKAGRVRDDVSPQELATYCIHALSAASNLPSKVAVRRLVTVTLAGLRPPR